MVVYGINPVLEALKAGRVSRVRIGPKGLARLHAAGAGRLDAVLPAMSPRLAEIVRVAQEVGVVVDIVDSVEVDRAARGGVHQGVVADVARLDEAWSPDRWWLPRRGRR